MRPLLRSDLDNANCSVPGCKHIHPAPTREAPMWIHGKCHPNAGVEVSYDGGGALTIACHLCQLLVAKVLVQGEGSR